MESRRDRIGLVAIVVAVMVVLSITAAWLLPSNNDSAVDAAPDSGPAVIVADIATVYDPVKAGDPLPDGFRQLLGRDQIAPVYDPEFATADQVDWPGDSLVIGIAGAELAKAYPVTHLNQREMVIDDLEGMPILVSW